MVRIYFVELGSVRDGIYDRGWELEFWEMRFLNEFWFAEKGKKSVGWKKSEKINFHVVSFCF